MLTIHIWILNFFVKYVECNWFILFKSFKQVFFLKLQESLDIETFVTIFF
jgi:hypothetical protein